VQHTVVIGSGFAGLTAIRQLRSQGYNAPITLISPRPIFFYFPSLIWVPAGKRSENDLTFSLEQFFARYNVDYHRGSVSKILHSENKVITESGAEINFDTLIIGSGGRFIKKLPGIEHVFTPCEGYAPTKAYTDRLNKLDSGTLAFGFASNPKEPAAMRGGPIFEFIFGIDTLLRQQGRRDKFKIIFFSPAPRPGQRLGAKAVDKLLEEMQKRDITTHLGHKMKGFTETSVITEEQELHSDLTLFMPGMTGPVWAAESDLPLSEGGFVKATQQCTVPETTNVYIAGDAGSFPGPDWMPKQAHMADLQADTVAKNIIAASKGQPAHHSFKTELMCIVDTLDKGILVHRTEKGASMYPKTVVFHWAKRFFEWLYLRKYK